MRFANTANVIGASMSLQRGLGFVAGWFKNAIREAARLGLLTVEERRREGRRNLPNVVRIVSKEWTIWLAQGRAGEPSRKPSR